MYTVFGVRFSIWMGWTLYEPGTTAYGLGTTAKPRPGPGTWSNSKHI